MMDLEPLATRHVRLRIRLGCKVMGVIECVGFVGGNVLEIGLGSFMYDFNGAMEWHAVEEMGIR